MPMDVVMAQLPSCWSSPEKRSTATKVNRIPNLDEGLKIRQAPFRKGQISWAKTLKNPWNGSVLLRTSMGNHHFCWGKSPRFFLSSFANRARCCAFFFRHLAPLQRLPHRLETQGSFWGSHGWPVFLGKRQIAAWKIQVIWSEQSSTLVASKPVHEVDWSVDQASGLDSWLAVCWSFLATTWRLIFSSSDSCKLARMGVSFREFTYRKQPIFWMVPKHGFPMRFSDQTWQCNIPHL